MKKGSDFVFAYLKTLNQKELAKLKFMLKIDEHPSELKLVELAEAMENVDEEALLKKSGYTKKSFHKIKSDLKTYLLTTSGYQERVYNQQLLEQMSIAQGILRRRFVREGEKILDELAELATKLGANQYAIVALGIKSWSIIFNQQMRFSGLHTVFEEIDKRLKIELEESPYSILIARVMDLTMHDPGLREEESRKTLEELIASPLLTRDMPSQSPLVKWLILVSWSSTFVLTRQFAKAIDKMGTIISTRHGKPPYRPSQELTFMFEYQCQNALLSKDLTLVNEYVPLFCEYSARSFPKNEMLQLKVQLYRCWQSIANKELEAAVNHFKAFLKISKRSFSPMTERQQFDCIAQAVLISLNLSKECRSNLMSFAISVHFTPEWNETYNTSFRILELFIKFDEVVFFKQGKLTVKNDSLFSEANRIKDIFRKKTNSSEFEFEIKLCTLFLGFKKGVVEKKVLTTLKRFALYCSNATEKEKINYVMRYHDYFDFNRWALNQISAIESNSKGSL
ncbi:MAG: hypothetical protein KIS94_02385 [Chitinophagales bacterium]|nr:hypothetical protein [Chitinophagales bacterium]